MVSAFGLGNRVHQGQPWFTWRRHALKLELCSVLRNDAAVTKTALKPAVPKHKPRGGERINRREAE
jgi:hypothetical protein